MARFETEESAFNFAVEYLKDISHSLKVCKMMAFKGDMDGWLCALEIVYRELSVKTNETEDTEFENCFKEIYVLMNNKETRIYERNKILKKMSILEIKLRKKLQEKGMLLPSKADPRFAILER